MASVWSLAHIAFADKELELSNIKIRVKIEEKINIKRDIRKEVKVFGNFTTCKQDGFTFSFFLNSKFVNITGIRSEQEIGAAVACLKSLVKGVRLSEEKHIVDNRTYTGKIKGKNCKNINFGKIVENKFFNESRIIAYPRGFPAIIVKTDGIPTILLFRSGNFNIVGAKDLGQALQSLNLLMELARSNEKKHGTMYK